jgi:hypothetical protein
VTLENMIVCADTIATKCSPNEDGCLGSISVVLCSSLVDDDANPPPSSVLAKEIFDAERSSSNIPI